MSKYPTRREFLAWLDAQPPLSHPCKGDLCPIAQSVNGRINSENVLHGPDWMTVFAVAVDVAVDALGDDDWTKLTASHIRRIYDETFGVKR